MKEHLQRIRIQQAEKLLAEGVADLIGVGRAMMQDATWSERALASLK